jgi:hypothetical protein
MATTFTTTVTLMYTLQQPDPNYVVNVFWRMTGVDGEYTAFVDGNTDFDSSQQTTPFIPYNELTEALVTSWIPEAVIASSQACVQGQINSLISPPVPPMNTPLPWAQA